jgi:hypothetical protein
MDSRDPEEEKREGVEKKLVLKWSEDKEVWEQRIFRAEIMMG